MEIFHGERSRLEPLLMGMLERGDICDDAELQREWTLASICDAICRHDATQADGLLERLLPADDEVKRKKREEPVVHVTQRNSMSALHDWWIAQLANRRADVSKTNLGRSST